MSIAFIAANPTVVSALETLRTVATVGEVAVATGVALLPEICVALSAMQGDSTPKTLIADPQQQSLRGLNRFASSVPTDGEQAVSDASPVPVDLPNDPTESATTAVDVARPIDWLALLERDPRAFFAQVRRYLMEYKAEILRRLERGDTLDEIKRWLDDETEKNIDPLAEIQRTKTGKLPKGFSPIMHDVARQFMDFYSIQYGYLEAGDVDAVRRCCQSGFQTLDEVVDHLKLVFGVRVQILFEKMVGANVRFRSKKEAQQVVRILENLVRNITDLPHASGIPWVIITFFDDGIHLAVSDTRSGFVAGMSPETVLNLNQEGVRVHNGEVIISETESTKGHGYGWQSIRDLCRAQGIQWHIWSDWNSGTTVTLTLPDGFFVP